MEKSLNKNQVDDMVTLCSEIKYDILTDKFRECEEILARMMFLYPHAPEPHNFYGIVLEKKGQHTLAMKHFRASADLDPTFTPAVRNLENSGSFYGRNNYFVFDRQDCLEHRTEKLNA